MFPSKSRILLFSVAVAAFAGLMFFGLRSLRRPVPSPTYIGTAACATCHQDAYQNWQESDHRHAMEVANERSVLGDFKNATFDYYGVKSRFFMRDGKYCVETDNAAGKLETFQISYTFGHYPLQQYLIAFPDGRLQALSIAWDSRSAAQGGQHWYHLYPKEKVTHDDPLHWTGAFQNWNSRCASCHSTDLVKNYSRETDRYDTHWKELNVGCEACHGPGSQHLAWANGKASLENKGLMTRVGKVWEAVNGRRPIPQVDFKLSGQIQTCSACHSLRLELLQPDLTANYFDNYRLSPLLEGRYYADGQIQAEVYETGSFLQSRMFQSHVSCTNCHEPHSGRVRLAGNKLCLQCHETEKFQTRDHFFHDPESPGAQCVNCHMPRATYMGVDVRRDHSFRVPDPTASVEFGVPNACTQCHKDRDNRWAADVIGKRTGRKQPWYPYAALLTAARRNDPAVLPTLLDYARATANPPILRSIAVLESARFPSPQQLESVSSALASPDPLVRLGAVSALSNSADAGERLSRLEALLADPVKSVRMAVARQLIEVPLGQAPAEIRPALGRLFDEYKESLLYNADMPESMNDLGLFLAAQGDPTTAEHAIRQALKLAPRYLPAMLNLSDIYRAQHRDDLGEQVLREAIAAYPESGDPRHALGLLYVRTVRVADSLAPFAEARRLAPENAQYALVYAAALVENGKRAEGIQVLQAAVHRFPDNAVIRQALEAYKSQ